MIILHIPCESIDDASKLKITLYDMIGKWAIDDGDVTISIRESGIGTTSGGTKYIKTEITCGIGSPLTTINTDIYCERNWFPC